MSSSPKVLACIKFESDLEHEELYDKFGFNEDGEKELPGFWLSMGYSDICGDNYHRMTSQVFGGWCEEISLEDFLVSVNSVKRYMEFLQCAYTDIKFELVITTDFN